MKNVTIALDDETHRRARIRAAELGTSLSALVKDYLTGLVDGGAAPQPQHAGVRDMQMPFHHDHPPTAAVPVPGSKGPDGQPYFVNGEWTFTKDGKPRKPGALRDMWVADDFDEWPDGFLDAIYGDDTPAADQWWRDANNVLKKPKDQ